MVTRPLWAVVMVTLLVVWVLVLVVTLFGASDPPVLVLFAPLIIIVLVAVMWFFTRRSVDLAYPAGSTASGRLIGDELEHSSALASGRVHLKTIRSVHPTPSALMLVMRSSFVVALLPRALFTPDEVARMRDRVAALRRS